MKDIVRPTGGLSSIENSTLVASDDVTFDRETVLRSERA